MFRQKLQSNFQARAENVSGSLNSKNGLQFQNMGLNLVDYQSRFHVRQKHTRKP